MTECSQEYCYSSCCAGQLAVAHTIRCWAIRPRHWLQQQQQQQAKGASEAAIKPAGAEHLYSSSMQQSRAHSRVTPRDCR